MPDDIDTKARRYDGGVEFLLSHGKHVLVVRVTDEALTGSTTRPNHTELFEHRRYAIESVARRKFMAEDLEDDGSILLTSADL